MKSVVLAVLFLALGIARANPSRPQSRVVNGEQSELVPYVAMIDAYNEIHYKYGEGTFISRRHILIQADMIHGYLLWWAYIHNDSKNGQLNSLFSTVDAVYMHPEFNPETLENDIGVLMIPDYDEGTVFWEHIFLPQAFASTPLPGDQGIVRGCGATSTEPFKWPLSLRTSPQRVLPDEECKELLGDRGSVLSGSHFCAIDRETRTSLCTRDEGAGFVVEDDDGTLIVLGLASFISNMCNPDFPSAYTRVSPYITWIYSIMDQSIDDVNSQ